MTWSTHHLDGPGELATTYFRLDGKQPGKTIVFCGGVHGDEYTGVEVIYQLMEQLPQMLERGRVVCYPCLNPAGARLAQRNLPRDGGDLNRSFPGRIVGSQASRYAHVTWESIISWEPDFVLDVHADAARSVPYVIVDRPVLLDSERGDHLMSCLVESAMAMGSEVLLEYAPRDYQRYGLQHSLAGSLVNFGEVEALTLEVGGRNATGQDILDRSIASIFRLLSHLGVLDCQLDRSEVVRKPWLRSSTNPTKKTGIFVPRFPAGALFQKGDVLAHIRGIEGEMLEELIATSDGVVIAWRDIGWVKTGTVLGTLGEAID